MNGASPLTRGLDVEDMAVLVHGPPQVLPHSVDLDEHLIEMPFIAWPVAGGVPGPELLAPLPDGLMEMMIWRADSSSTSR